MRGPVRRPRAWLAGCPRQDPPTGRHGDEEDQIRSVATATRISCQGTAWVYMSAVVEQQGAAVIPWEDRIPGRT